MPRGKDELHLYNTLTRKKEVFRPLEPGKAKVFTCGPSVYRRPHLGNYRTFLFEDILVRYLEHLGYKVERVLNFTDIEDKAIEEAEKEGMDVFKLTEMVARIYQKETEQLMIKPPTYNPRSSDTVDQATLLIKVLLDKGIAYWHGVDVYYDPLKFKGFGKLFRLDMKKWPKKSVRFKKDTYPEMRWNLGDFILWHGCGEGENVCWDEELGSGRPSWNVQDPAMATKHLGFNIDIHCGGVDNLYRHHDYSLAVVEGATGEEFCHYWLHGEHLLVKGKKMSKSKGKLVYLEQLMEKGFSARDVRFFLIAQPYRKKLDLDLKALSEARERLHELRGLLEFMESRSPAGEEWPEATAIISNIRTDFKRHMNDDLDVQSAFNSMERSVASIHRLSKLGKVGSIQYNALIAELKRIDEVLQVIF